MEHTATNRWVSASPQTPPPGSENALFHRHRRLVVLALLVVQGVLATTSLWKDSITFDESVHLSSGLSYWLTGDYRLAPEHPPLPRMWCALPLLFMNHGWTDNPPGWEDGQFWRVGAHWFSAAEERERLLRAGRYMMVLILLGTTLVVYIVAFQLWGAGGALLATTVAVLCPTLLAHGRLVTTDLPVACCALLCLERFSALARAITPWRLASAGLALTAFALSKFSWPLMLPALVVMAAGCVVRRAPLVVGWGAAGASAEPCGKGRCWTIEPRGKRAMVLGLVSLACVAMMWAGIWSMYGWRFSPFADQDRDYRDPADWGSVLPDTDSDAWHSRGEQLIKAVHAARPLPEAYLYGMAYVVKSTRQRDAYLMGEYSSTGWASFFPIAFVIKTPVATMVLILLGAAALWRRRAGWPLNFALLCGLGTFLVFYAATAVGSSINIGHRHILPLYPVLIVLAGGAAGFWSSRAGRVAVAGCVAALALTTLRAHPHYLSYFNEAVGGPASGHRYLADSNIDWGQDLKRLADHVRAHAGEQIKLAYFGSVDPRAYGFAAGELPSSFQWGEPASLTAGTYVVSVTQLLGVYLPEVRPGNEEPLSNQLIAALDELVRAGLYSSPQAALGAPQVNHLRACLLLSRLRERPPDERIGWSLWVYRLTDEEAVALSTPQGRTSS